MPQNASQIVTIQVIGVPGAAVQASVIGGTLRFAWGGQSVLVDWSDACNLATLQSLLQGLSTVGPANLIVDKAFNATPVDGQHTCQVHFASAKGNAPQPHFAVTDNGLKLSSGAAEANLFIGTAIPGSA